MTKGEERLTLRRGDVIWLNCDPSVGVEPQKTRTCVIVSNDIANQFGQAVTVVPTQQHTAGRAARAYMVDLRSPRSTLREKRVANCSMVMSYDRSRVFKLAGRVSPEALEEVGAALALHLGLDS